MPISNNARFSKPVMLMSESHKIITRARAEYLSHLTTQKIIENSQIISVVVWAANKQCTFQKAQSTQLNPKWKILRSLDVAV